MMPEKNEGIMKVNGNYLIGASPLAFKDTGVNF